MGTRKVVQSTTETTALNVVEVCETTPKLKVKIIDNICTNKGEWKKKDVGIKKRMGEAE